MCKDENVLKVIRSKLGMPGLHFDVDLVADGIIDSMAFMELILYIAKETKYRFDYESLDAATPSKVGSIINAFEE